MKRVAVTGASGTIGRAITAGLASDYELRPMSRSIDGTDLSDPEGLTEKFVGCDAVIHLAWRYAPPAPGISGGGSGGRNYYDNIRMNLNVLDAAQAAGVTRLINASSVHADHFYDWEGPGLLAPKRSPRANGPYGAAKVVVEEYAGDLAGSNFRVANLRYGGVTADDQPHPTDDWERRVWLSHADLCALLRRILDAPAGPDHCVIYAVSDNEDRVHDTVNPFGWEPRGRASRLGGHLRIVRDSDDA